MSCNGLFHRFRVVVLLVPLSFGILMAQSHALPENKGVVGFGLALRRLPTVGSVLNITAHPDDENNALLARLRRGEGYRTGLLTLTRGAGGQNEIGSELFEALGVLRSAELMAVHRHDDVEQFFTRAYEFGYSFSVEETMQKWGRRETLRDIVRVIRKFRPLVLLTMNPGGSGGGQHHQASAQLAAEAFRIASDPNQFPEQIEEGLRPWRPLRLFQSPGASMRSSQSTFGDVRIELGVYDPLLGESYAEFGARARNNHRSQGMNALSVPGPVSASFILAYSNVSSSQIRTSFFDQVDVSLQALSSMDPGLESSVILLEGYIDWARDAFSRSDYRSAVKAVMTGLDLVREMRESTKDPDARFLLLEKEKDFLYAAKKGHFFSFDVLTTGVADGNIVPGEEFRVQVRLINPSSVEVQKKSVELLTPPGWEVHLLRSDDSSTDFTVTVPEDASPSQPFWFRQDRTLDRYEVREGFDGTEAFPPPLVTARIVYESFGIEAILEAPAQRRWFDASIGRESRAEIKVVPEFSVALDPAMSAVPMTKSSSSRLRVTVTNHSKSEATTQLNLQVPSGWRVTPRSAQLDFSSENQTRSLWFSVRPPAGVREGVYTIEAVATTPEKSFSSGFHVISYPHIQTRHYYVPARTEIRMISVNLPPGLRVGYIMGAGDNVGLATEQLGARVTYLDEDELSTGDLSRFDTIVTGIRAYLNREDLISNNHRLLTYVRNGGNLVVQYNKYEFLREQFAPYPVSISRPHDRITVEDSSVRLLQPNHPIFNLPNRIQQPDWDGWVQERGLYFLSEWDEPYTPLLELQDPWPYNSSPKRGSLVVTQFGKGHYVYTGLAFFRQLPAGVPGAYRLWANIISFGRSAGQR